MYCPQWIASSSWDSSVVVSFPLAGCFQSSPPASTSPSMSGSVNIKPLLVFDRRLNRQLYQPLHVRNCLYHLGLKMNPDWNSNSTQIHHHFRLFHSISFADHLFPFHIFLKIEINSVPYISEGRNIKFCSIYFRICSH